MRLAKLLNDSFTLGVKYQEIELYTLEEVASFPNISEHEVELCTMFSKDGVAGFAKMDIYTDNYPVFVQKYPEDIEEITQ